MQYYGEKEIVDIVSRVIGGELGAKREEGRDVPVEISARHVHLSREDCDRLFGKGHELTPKRDLSQPGQYLAQERLKLVTERGQIANVAVLGPLRTHTQVELSLTDARTLGISAPVRLSGDLSGAADVLLVGPQGAVWAAGSAIAAKAHVHMTPEDARAYGVQDGQAVGICLKGERQVRLEDVIVRVSDAFALAVHIDYDEANAAGVRDAVTGRLTGGR